MTAGKALAAFVAAALLLGLCGPAGANIIPPTLNWDAALDTPGDRYWDSTVNATSLRRWDFGTSETPINVTDRLGSLTKAYSFPSAAATMASFDIKLGFAGTSPTLQSHSFELVFRTPDLSGDHILFETGGGTDGTVLKLTGSTLTYIVKDSGAMLTRTLSDPEAGTFHSVVGTYLRNSPGTTDTVSLYWDGVLVGSAVTATGLDHWAGSNDSGLGRLNSSAAGGGTFTSLNGEIAILRFYRDKALTADEVLQNYRALPEPATLSLLALGALGLVARRRRRR